MLYPWWYIPLLTAPMLIALVSVIHVLAAMYAVGGGVILAAENRRAVKKKDKPYRDYLKKHARFFLLLTILFGGVTGVGVWWTIGLASPLATETLIRIFVFGWAIEWVFFVIEIVALFVFYYYWDKLPESDHVKVGIIYGLAAWISLVIITGITAFMLNSRGLFGDWMADGSFWSAFLNRQFLPQTIARTGASLLLATLYIWLHATYTDINDAVRESVVRRMSRWALAGIGLFVLGVAGWFFFLPKTSLLTLQRAAALNVLLVLGAAILAAMTLLIILGPLRSPKRVTFPMAAALFLFGLAAVGTCEFVREAVRKPFIVDRLVYGNQVTPAGVDATIRNGFLASGVWTRLYLAQLQEKYPNLAILPPETLTADPASEPGAAPMTDIAAFEESGDIVWTQYRYQQPRQRQPLPEPTQAPAPLNQTPAFAPAATVPESPSQVAVTPPPSNAPSGFTPYSAVRSAEIDSAPRPGSEELLKMEEADRLETGRVIFMYHCNDCHASKWGYSAAAPMLVGKTRGEIAQFVRHLNRPGINMPPWCGNDAEAQLLAEYLVSIRPEIPQEDVPNEQPNEQPAETPDMPTESTAANSIG